MNNSHEFIDMNNSICNDNNNRNYYYYDYNNNMNMNNNHDNNLSQYHSAI